MSNEELIKIASEARLNSYSPISKFKVGAAVLTSDGHVFKGCNIEDPSLIGLTNICAERCAIINAISNGYKSFDKIAVVGGKKEIIDCMPCGICRQYLNSFSKNVKVVCIKNNSITELSLNELLPLSFDETFEK